MITTTVEYEIAQAELQDLKVGRYRPSVASDEVQRTIYTCTSRARIDRISFWH